MVDDLERRINPLFDALNCETLSRPVCEQLLILTRAMEAHDREQAMAIHMDLLTRGSLTDDIGLWMSGIKQLKHSGSRVVCAGTIYGTLTSWQRQKRRL
ncbi:hypothetical protein L226DRAFT_537076 [Lentinus tigrinus ALCF2SS1-7]|uniref:Uncharacterized protein n=1 Tax=Lentinus tigrinus ALCF2SS1-6 TaxID=1328759 RepID=A0A5C2RX83_9APHY|nr:hypothetical protein L227DRAFT_579565 [Lentinus tigrinus ALCF2SS1-6]RPD72558.1 hypothetical protein L226DRAFT_537076 [Lentinus tigrinus ALCF2SS1-7]